jgi:hypothetical protein
MKSILFYLADVARGKFFLEQALRLTTFFNGGTRALPGNCARWLPHVQSICGVKLECKTYPAPSKSFRHYQMLLKLEKGIGAFLEGSCAHPKMDVLLGK